MNYFGGLIDDQAAVSGDESSGDEDEENVTGDASDESNESDKSDEEVGGSSRRRTTRIIRDSEEEDTESSDSSSPDDRQSAQRLDAAFAQAAAEAEDVDAKRIVAQQRARRKVSNNNVYMQAPAAKLSKRIFPPKFDRSVRQPQATHVSSGAGPPATQLLSAPQPQPAQSSSSCAFESGASVVADKQTHKTDPHPVDEHTPQSATVDIVPHTGVPMPTSGSKLVAGWLASNADDIDHERVRVTDLAIAEDAVALALAHLRGFSVCDREKLSFPKTSPNAALVDVENLSWDALATEAERMVGRCDNKLYTQLGMGVGESNDHSHLFAAFKLLSPLAIKFLCEGETAHCFFEMRELRVPASQQIIRQAMAQAIAEFPPDSDVYRNVVARVYPLLRSFRTEDGKGFVDADLTEAGTVAVVCPVIHFTNYAVDGSGASACTAYVNPSTWHAFHLVGRNHAFSFSTKDLSLSSRFQGPVTIGLCDDKIVFAGEIDCAQSTLLQRLNTIMSGAPAPMRRVILPLQEGQDNHSVTREKIQTMEPSVVVLLSRAAVETLSAMFDRKEKAQRFVSLDVFEHGIEAREGEGGSLQVTEPLDCSGGYQISSDELTPALNILTHARRLGFVTQHVAADTPAYVSVDEKPTIDSFGALLARASISVHGFKTMTRCPGPWLLLLLYKGWEQDDEDQDGEPSAIVAVRSLGVDSGSLDVSEAIVACCMPSDA